jgi:hypothetical protein
MKQQQLPKLASITAGVIAALSTGYQGLAAVWHLPLATEVVNTGYVLVATLSMVLAAFTGQKIILNKELTDTVTDIDGKYPIYKDDKVVNSPFDPEVFIPQDNGIEVK